MANDGNQRRRRDALAATLAYAALTIALTWPLARGLTHDIPGDLGDPLLNCWILAWDADRLLQAISGHPAALAAYWNANIFAPHPYALAYSEHLTTQAVAILPVYAVTRNPVLCHNLLFLATFATSGVAMFLFVRELTGNRAAAFVAGLAYAFAPYRFGSIPHLQVLSSMWMPLVLLGLRRFFVTHRTTPLACAAAAWTAQNLSCSYYLLFFSPVVGLYLAWELTNRRLWRDVRTLTRLFAAIAVVVIATAPFVWPYLQLRRLGFMPRSIAETDRFAADVYGYLTADAILRVWGSVMRAWPKAEGWLFPGLTIAVLAVTAIVVSWRDARTIDAPLKRRATATRFVARAFSRAVIPVSRVAALAWLVSSAITVALLFGWTLRLPFIKITSFDRALFATLAFALILLTISPRARTTTRAWLAAPVGILTLLTLFAIVMSFGPDIDSRGKLIEARNVYRLFYDYVPGFDGLRVPARFGMIVVLGLAALAGCGIAAIQRRQDAKALTAIAATFIVIESIAVPLPLNGNDTNYKQHDLVPLPGSIAVGDRVPAVYRYIARLPSSAAVLEMPFGEVAFDARYMFYSTTHWRRLVNGYSGGSPEEYGLLAGALNERPRQPERAWTALMSSAATHVVVHEASYVDDKGAEVSGWLRHHGAPEVASFDGDRIFALPRSPQ